MSTYDYDYIGRRVRKSVDVLDGSGSDYVVTWVYSGRSSIEERRVENGTRIVKRFMWGLDLSAGLLGGNSRMSDDDELAALRSILRTPRIGDHLHDSNCPLMRTRKHRAKYSQLRANSL